MRSPTDICLLCKTNKSTQKNSHIIPKFFGCGLFYDTNPRHSIKLNKTGKTEKVQDILKEDYLLCPECEKGFSIFETYCSFRMDRFNDLRYFSKFNRFKHGEFEYFECKDLDIRIFNLFIYSIVWRISVSNNYAFQNFKLHTNEEEKVRLILRNFITQNQTELVEKLYEFKIIPGHSHLIIRPNKKLRPPRSMMSAASMDEQIHKIHLVDYLIFYITDKEKLVEGFKEIDNNNLDNRVKVGLTSPERWESYNLNLINETINLVR